MKTLVLCLILIISVNLRSQDNSNSYVEYLPDNLFDAVALIEYGDYHKDSQGNDSVDYQPVASSILLFSNENYFIVTAGHVTRKQASLYLRLTNEDRSFCRISLESVKKKLKTDWVHDKKNDICALKINRDIIKNSRERPINADSLTADPSDYMLGTGIFIVGYPVSVSQIDYHVVRKGAISAFINKNEFLIDCFVFPGNSGGPVFLSAVPDIITATKYSGLDFEMTIPGRESKLLGMVTDYLPYTELAISNQTGKSRIRFEENSGLSVAISATVILEFIKNLE